MDTGSFEDLYVSVLYGFVVPPVRSLMIAMGVSCIGGIVNSVELIYKDVIVSVEVKKIEDFVESDTSEIKWLFFHACQKNMFVLVLFGFGAFLCAGGL